MTKMIQLINMYRQQMNSVEINTQLYIKGYILLALLQIRVQFRVLEEGEKIDLRGKFILI